MTLSYLATPYTKFQPDLDAAYRAAAKLCGRLLDAGVTAYSPIAHSHSLALHAGLDPLDEPMWYAHNLLLMARCDSLIVAHLPGWDDSKGVAFEIAHFRLRGDPIFDLDPETLRMARRQ